MHTRAHIHCTCPKTRAHTHIYVMNHTHVPHKGIYKLVDITVLHISYNIIYLSISETCSQYTHIIHVLYYIDIRICPPYLDYDYHGLRCSPASAVTVCCSLFPLSTWHRYRLYAIAMVVPIQVQLAIINMETTSDLGVHYWTNPYI